MRNARLIPLSLVLLAIATPNVVLAQWLTAFAKVLMPITARSAVLVQ